MERISYVHTVRPGCRTSESNESSNKREKHLLCKNKFQATRTFNDSSPIHGDGKGSMISEAHPMTYSVIALSPKP